MKTNTLALSLLFAVASGAVVLACSTDDAATPGPVNTPPASTTTSSSTGSSTTSTPTGTSSNPNDGGSAPACTGPSFDNTRIPGWPTVPSP